MRRLSISLFSFLIGFFFILSAGWAQHIFTHVRSLVLPNGLRVFILEDHKVPVINHMVIYHVGSGDEQPFQRGWAHLLEHMAFKKSRYFPKGNRNEKIAGVGGVFNGTTSKDQTLYWVMAPKETLPELMKAGADRMQGLLFDKKELEVEKEVVLKEYNMRVGSVPLAQLQMQLDKAYYGYHSYASSPIGNVADIRRASRQDLKTFYHHWYCPNNATLFISGDVKYRDVQHLLRESYGKIKKCPTSFPFLRNRSDVDTIKGFHLVAMNYVQKGMPSVASLLYPMDSIYSDMRAKRTGTQRLHRWAQLGLFSKMLEIYLSEKVEKTKKVVDLGLETNYESLGPAYLEITAEAGKGVSLLKVRQFVEEQVQKFSSLSRRELTGILRQARARLITEIMYQTDNTRDSVSFLAGMDSIGFTPKQANSIESTLKDVTITQIQSTAKAIFAGGASFVGELRGDGKSEESLRSVSTSSIR